MNDTFQRGQHRGSRPTRRDWCELDVAARDRLYWEVLCSWPRATDWNPVQEGLDYGHLTRHLLWDKVGKAIRAIIAFDSSDSGTPVVDDTPPVGTQEPAAHSLKWRDRLRCVGGEWRRCLHDRPLLFCPFPYSRHARVIKAILEHAPQVAVGVPCMWIAQWPGAMPVRTYGTGQGPSTVARAHEIARAIEEGLAAHAVALPDPDRLQLQNQLEVQQQILAAAAATLGAMRPAAILLPADNHSPFIEYALMARRLHIPAIMLQHGLDCERYTLDDAYASHIAVWGPDRATRYRRDSSLQPDAVEVIGNPHYDKQLPATAASTDPSTWLWVTRPHVQEKCHVPSRCPDEGLRILNALLQARTKPGVRLLIKPHPFDYADAYRKLLAEGGVQWAVVTQDPMQNLLSRANVVITEDSTAGMDAMLAGGLLIHAHFAPTPPVVPFAAYGAALPGFSPAELAASLASLPSLTCEQQASMRAHQSRFLDDFAGPRDGRAAARFARFVAEVLVHHH